MEPFSKAKYKALVDGLACSEIDFSSVFHTATLRLDSEYYQKEYLEIERFIKKNSSKFSTIASRNLQVDASAFYPSLEPYYNTGEIPFIRVADVKTCIDYSSCVKIPEMDERFRTLHLCSPGDVVLTKGGRVGTAGLITKPSYVTRDLIFINSSRLSRKDYVALYLFFSSRFAYKQMVRSSSMTAQPHLTITLIRDLLVYDYSSSFKEIIEKLFTQAETFNLQAETLYSEAEQILADALHFGSKISPSSTIAVKSLSSTFNTTGRLDAEYYQPEYERHACLLNTKDTVSTLCNIYDKNYTPLANQEYLYIELSNVDLKGSISDVEKIKGSDLPSRARRKVKKGQVVISSVEGSLQSCALITEEFDGALCSTGFYVLDSDSINAETLLVLFKSEIVQALMKQRCSGTILTAITKDELLSMPFPRIDGNVQEEIGSKIRKSFALRHQAKLLLDHIRRAVEIVLERHEENAIQWLKEKGIDIPEYF